MNLGIDLQVDASSLESLNDSGGLVIEDTVDGDFVLLMEMVVGSKWWLFVVGIDDVFWDISSSNWLKLS